MAHAAQPGDRAIRRRLARLEAAVLELAAASRPGLIPRLMVTEPAAETADVYLEQAESGRWVAWGGSLISGGATREEALAALGRLLDEYPTIPSEAVTMGQQIAAEMGLQAT